MAIQYRKDRDKWRVYWRNPFTGKQESAYYATQLEAEKADFQIKGRLRFEPESFRKAEPVKEEDRSDDSLEAVYYAYLKEKRFSKDSLQSQLKAMKYPLELLGRKRISAINRQDLAKVVTTIQATGVKATTLCSRIMIFFAVIRWAFKRGYLDSLPQFPDFPKGQSEHFIPPTEAEIVRLLSVASPHLQRVIIIGYATGVRIGPSELFKIRWKDVDFNRAVIQIHAAKKNPKEPLREVPIRHSLLPVLQTWMEEDKMANIDMVFHFQGKPITRIHTSWKTALKRAGITRRIRPYDLRHAFATEAIAAGADIGTVAKIMGHANVLMCLTHYQHVLTKQKIAVVESLPDVPSYAQACMPKKNSILQ